MHKNTFSFLLAICLTTYLFAQQKGVIPHAGTPAASTGVTRAVVVGISDYHDPAIPDLRFADKDAEAFANFLRSPAGGSLDDDHLKILTDSAATTAQFDAALGWLIDESKAGDQAIIYFSGHGDVETKTRSQQGFLLCWDSPPQSYVSGAYPIFFLKEVVSTLSMENKARVIVITDACRSGKLAGNSIGGSQLTSQNLAQQFANEIKILSCQPNEYSIEGEQWGGGRGAFSYNLIEGLYGLADGNADATVSLMEIGRYLEDHVGREAAPLSQVPMVIGNRTEKLAEVFPDLLAQVKKNKNGQAPLFYATDSRGIEEEVLATVDTSIRKTYNLFKKALKEKVFLEPEGACADAYYRLLMEEPKLGRLHNAMRRNYAAALQDDAQMAVNNLMKMEKTEVRLYRLERVQKYAPYPRYLERASELLGKEHYIYPTLQARKCYFEGQVLQLQSPLNPDSILAGQILSKYREALQWEPDFGLPLLRMSQVFRTVLPNKDSAMTYAYKAIEKSPTWVFAINNTAVYLSLKGDFPGAKKLFQQSLAIDSTNTNTWSDLAVNYYFSLDLLDSTEHALMQSLKLDSSNFNAYYGYGILEFNGRDDMLNSEQYFLKAAQADKPGPNVYNYLGCIHSNQGDYTVAEKYFKQGLAIDPTHTLCNVFLASIYFKTKRSAEAEELIENAMTYDSSSAGYLWNLGFHGYYQNHKYNEAERVFKRIILLDATYTAAYKDLAYVYWATQQLEAAEAMFKKAIQLSPTVISYNTYLAKFYMVNKRFAEADSLYEKAIVLAPKTAYYRNVAGYNKMMYQHDYAGSIPYFKKAIELYHGDFNFYDNLIFAYTQLAQYDSVVQVAKDWLSVDSLSLLARLRLGQAYQQSGKKAEAQVLFRHLLTDSPTEMDAYPVYFFRIIGQVLSGQRDTLAAYIESEKLKSLKKDNFCFYAALAYGFTGQNEQAIYWLSQQQDFGHFAYGYYDNYDFKQLVKLPEFNALMKKHFPLQVKD